jgi:hypothetical protein
MAKNVNISNSVFWLKQLALCVIIIVIAVAVLMMQRISQSDVRPEGEAGPKSISSNMSNFYEDYRLSSRSRREEGLGDFVMEVNLSEQPLGERLIKKESLQKPMSGRWVGEHKHRIFKAGSTLRSAITGYAQSEGMQVIWELDQDFIVKHAFQVDDSMLGSLKIIANAIDPNFDGEVQAYMCPRQRSLVITATKAEYLQAQCVNAND